MRRREFISLVGGVAAAWPFAARAQQAERMRRIGVLYGGVSTDVQAQAGLTRFTRALEELGWTPGRNIEIEYRFAAGDTDRMATIAKELVELKLDVLVAHTTPVVAALQRETRTIPIVFVVVSDPVGSGFVTSLPRPGGNITGFTNIEASLGGKWIDLLKEAVPRITRAALMFNPDTAPHWDYYWRPFETAARALAVEPIAARVGTTEDIERFVTSFVEVPDCGLVVMADVFMAINVNRDLIIALAERYRLPTIYPFRFMTTAGGLMSYGIDVYDLWQRAPTYVDRILKGAKPAVLPVQLPTKFELVVNLKAARALGLDVPWFLQQRADEVIE
jgi:putative ABC transport system substrate-binding protein